MDTPEATVAHDQGDIPGSYLVQNERKELISTLRRVGCDTSRSNTIDNHVHIHEIFLSVIVAEWRATQEHRSCLIKRSGVALFKYLAPAGVGSGLEYGYDAAGRPAFYGRLNGGSNGGGVVCEVVDNNDAARFTSDLLTPLDAFESAESSYDFVHGQSFIQRYGGHRQGIQEIVAPAER